MFLLMAWWKIVSPRFLVVWCCGAFFSVVSFHVSFPAGIRRVWHSSASSLVQNHVLWERTPSRGVLHWSPLNCYWWFQQLVWCYEVHSHISCLKNKVTWLCRNNEQVGSDVWVDYIGPDRTGRKLKTCMCLIASDDNLRSIWSSLNLHASEHKFFTVWPPNGRKSCCLLQVLNCSARTSI